MKDQEPLSVLASRYKVHPNQIGLSRTQFLNNSQMVFSGYKSMEKEFERIREENEYAHKVGELTMDVEFLKKTGLAMKTEMVEWENPNMNYKHY